MATRCLTGFLMVTLGVVLSSGLMPAMTEAASPASVTVAGGRVKINGEILTDYVSRQVFAATGNAGDATHAAQQIQNALNEAILAWRPLRDPARWPGMLEEAMNRMRQGLVNERRGLAGDGARLQAHETMATILSHTAGELRLFPLHFVRFLQPQSLAALESPAASQPARSYPGAPCPGGRPRINVATNLMYWSCP